MSSLSSIIAARGNIAAGDPDGDDIKVLQIALQQAGYRVADDGVFGPRTQMVVEQFQAQHGLKDDGVVGLLTAAMLDAPHQVLLKTAKPQTAGGFGTPLAPHDDTASLLAFYGKPWEDDSLGFASAPWNMYYGSQLITHFQLHKKCIEPFNQAVNRIWAAAGQNNDSALLKHVKNFSGAYNYRPVRGSSRLSCHAFGAAIDFDAETLPLGKPVPSITMPQEIVDAFKAAGWFWGGDYIGRKDPMHFQFAHE